MSQLTERITAKARTISIRDDILIPLVTLPFTVLGFVVGVVVGIVRLFVSAFVVGYESGLRALHVKVD